MERDPDTVRLAVPNKGRIADPVAELLEKSGLHVIDPGERRLVSRTADPYIEVLFARPVDIPDYVASGAADLGITGHDMVCERGVDVDEILDLPVGHARLVLAVPEESPAMHPEDLRGMRVATEFPNLTRSYFERRSVAVSIVRVGGACEATPLLGIADAIIDLSSSGTTLKANHMREVDEVLRTTTVLIANRAAPATREPKMEEVRLALESVIRASGQCYLMMNASRRCIEEIRNVLPGLSGPTVMEVASREDLVAIHAVVEEKSVPGLIPRLRRAGAKDILVMGIQRMIR